jgi:glycosyltransferase involved in cell wall biosynthesis
MEKKPMLTIGLPVYNGENGIRRSIDSILAQTFTDFELIISDNASTDSTSDICSEYEKKDSRVRHVRHSETRNFMINWRFPVEQAKGKYFMWISDDDIWEDTFVEKNIEILESHPKVVGSISNIKLFGPNIKNYMSNSKESQSKLKIVRSVTGTYEEKVKKILEFNWCLNLYSIFRTKELKKSLVYTVLISWDFAVMLSVIEFGEFYVLDEVLLKRGTEGATSNPSFMNTLKVMEIGWLHVYFPYVTYTIWCMKKLGLRLFLKHFSHFKYLNLHSEKKILREIIKSIFKNQ